MMHLPPPIKPLPLLPPLVVSLSILAAQNLRPISEALLSRHLRTRTTLAGVSISPTQLRVKGLRFLDTNTQPLLTADDLHVRITRKKMFCCNIVATGLVLHVDINPVDWQDSNWSSHLARIRQEIGSDTQITKQPVLDDGKEEMKMQVPKGTLAVSITSQQAAIRIKRPSLTLSLPPLVIPSTDLSSVSAIQRLVNGLLGKAARDAGSKSFPRELRTGARRAARGVSVTAVDKLFGDAGSRIRRLREKVDDVRLYLEDIPDIDGAQRTMKNVGGILMKLEGLLVRDENADNRDSRQRSDRSSESFDSGMRELDEGDAED